jgi:zeta-carotene desaturase
VPLADLYGGCRDAIEKRGGQVRMRCGVREIRVRDGRFAGALLEEGTELTADACVAAVPHDVLQKMLPAEYSATNAPLEGLSHIKTSPITGVHLWYDREVMTEPFLTLLDHTTQWVFNKTLLSEEAASKNGGGASAKGQYLQLVISASYDLVPMSRQDIIELCKRELGEVLPATKAAQVTKATVIKEVNATFSPEPGIDRWRPSQKSPIAGLSLAGDWTSTGWPSTMEGAVRSGYLAAERVMSGLGNTQKFLVPDLPFEGLSKLWAHKAENTQS